MALTVCGRGHFHSALWLSPLPCSYPTSLRGGAPVLLAGSGWGKAVPEAAQTGLGASQWLSPGGLLQPCCSEQGSCQSSVSPEFQSLPHHRLHSLTRYKGELDAASFCKGTVNTQPILFAWWGQGRGKGNPSGLGWKPRWGATDRSRKDQRPSRISASCPQGSTINISTAKVSRGKQKL